MVIIYPILTRIVGLENFGQIIVANALAGLLGIFVNYGTIQTSIKEVAKLKEDINLLSEVFCNTFTTRFIIFIVVAVFLGVTSFFIKENFLLYIFALPLVFAEVVNPMFFFLGVEKLKILNIANLLCKIVTLLFIIILIEGSKDFIWVNFLMGVILSFTYLSMIIWIVRKYRIKFILPSHLNQLLIFRVNFYLLVNNFSVHLQQSLMLFALQHWGNALWLGAYALCDKVIWSSRLLIISISSSIYPTSTLLYKESLKSWLTFKTKGKYILGILFFLGSLILLIFPDFIINILAGEENKNAVIYLKQMAFVPFIAALNSMNVLDRLIADDNKTIFNIACLITLLSCLCSYILISNKLNSWFGVYAILLEISALFLYEYAIKLKYKKSINF